MMVDFEDAPPAIDRRSVLRAGVWAAPVLVLATAAPAAAASVTPTGTLVFNNLSPNWLYGEGGAVVGVQANSSVRFAEGTGTIPLISLVLDIENADDQYLVDVAPTLIAGSPEWAAAGVGETVENAGGTWIRYMFTWTGSLAPNFSTAILEASIPFRVPLPDPPESSHWIIIASADGVEPATDEGTRVEIIEQTPP